MGDRRASLILAICTVVAAFLAFTGLAGAATTTVQLAAQNNSGITGTATLEDVAGGQTRVTITVQGAPAGVPMPVHIHEGSCASLNPAPKFTLTPIQNGRSETTVNATVADITGGQHAINAHKSAQELAVYVACGDIPRAQGGMPAAAPRTGAGGTAGAVASPWLLAAGVLLALAVGGVGLTRRRA